MIQTGYALPLALSICARLGSGWDRKACAGGAFMENINTQFGYRSPWLDEENPLYPCGVVDAADRRSCYLRASWRVLLAEGGSFAETARACARLGRWERTCLHGLGRDAAEKARYAPEPVRPLCHAAGAGEAFCLRGAARTIANASGVEGIAPAVRLCSKAPVEHRGECFAGVGVVVGLLEPTPASRRQACARHASAHADACFEAAKAEVDPSGRLAWG
jgi:hypothetical protein